MYTPFKQNIITNPLLIIIKPTAYNPEKGF